MKKYVFLLLLNIPLWLQSSNVAYLVATGRCVLLNRYSVDKFLFNMSFFVFSLACFFVISPHWKKRCLQVAIFSSSLAICCFAIYWIFPQNRTLSNTIAYYQPNLKVSYTFSDAPFYKRSYPTAIVGENSQVNFATDPRGFRNKQALEKADIVVIGDSFTEGVFVDDDHIWPALLAQKTQQKIYNLGISGAHPTHYYENLKRFGIPLKPKIVICMLYELNDFKKMRNYEPQKITHKILYFVRGLKMKILSSLLLDPLLGGIGSKSSFPQEEIFSWMPVTINTNQHYFFPIQEYRYALFSKDVFIQTPGWKQVSHQLVKIQDLCKKHHIQLLYVLAPSKVRTTFPIVQSQYNEKSLLKMLALQFPKLAINLEKIQKNFDNIEETLGLFLKEKGGSFYSLTKDLRRETSKSGQLYFTYDVHWNSLGHSVVSDAIFKKIRPLLEDNK
ncbi:SGNH/GDSL hydrolase family protein [Candidatus Uabimicrobium amorphum]|uniref:AlgX/AlgJ SGNH hydrolase-like domain-containing protein n=1 Tax=Uabimicrobium amorphum TaxID=2596890 RepID=A0A5S9F0J0_UABAM|nr:hypothetical protein [Candidatus Uabimicrobium amorphum]BBM81667.1 hypothetical protein UABAM_00006 [Candidatus Uabimicrobium amorphum]